MSEGPLDSVSVYSTDSSEMFEDVPNIPYAYRRQASLCYLQTAAWPLMNVAFDLVAL